MRKSYLLVYSDTFGTRENVKECIDAIPEVITWRFDLPNCFYLISENSANEIHEAIQRYQGRKGRYLITEITGSNKQGLLPSESWHMINHKRNKPKS